MKPILIAAAAAALMAVAGPLSAQIYAPAAPPQAVPPSAWHDAGPPGMPQAAWPDNGPQGTWMAQHGYTVNDTLPYAANDVASDSLNQQSLARSQQVHIRPPLPAWEPQ